MQDEYAGDKYYNAGYWALKNHDYDMEKHSEAMKAVLFSRSIQYGAGNMYELYTEASKSKASCFSLIKRFLKPTFTTV